MFDQKEYDKKRYADNREAMIATAMERQTRVREERRVMLSEYKTALGCATCPEKDHRCLDFHHKDPATKDANIGELTGGNIDRLWAEIDKCMLVCANCHRKLHYKEETHAAI